LRKLFNKNLILQMALIKAKKILIKNIKWLKSVSGARVQIKIYFVIIYKIKKNGRKIGERAKNNRVVKKIKYVILFKV